jgi:hypothetical protein
MTIGRAIEILTNLKSATNSASRKEVDAAYQLGIEALEREQGRRDIVFSRLWGALPSETP